MREAIGGTWIFQIVIAFILLFTGFICLSVNRSKAFAVKDQIVQVIQSYNGINVETGSYDDSKMDAFYDIVNYIKASSYRNTGVKPEDEKIGDEVAPYYCFTRDGRPSRDNNATFCIAPISVKDDACNVSMDCEKELPSMKYYKVVVFYQLDIPIFHDLFNFKVVGDTKTMFGEAR